MDTRSSRLRREKKIHIITNTKFKSQHLRRIAGTCASAINAEGNLQVRRNICRYSHLLWALAVDCENINPVCVCVCFGVRVHFHLTPGSAYLFAIISLPLSLYTPASHQWTGAWALHRFSIVHHRWSALQGKHGACGRDGSSRVPAALFLLTCLFASHIHHSSPLLRTISASYAPAFLNADGRLFASWWRPLPAPETRPRFCDPSFSWKLLKYVPKTI